MAGIGVGYTMVQSSSTSIEIEQVMNDPQKMQQIHDKMMGDKQHMNQMMGPMMENMMGDSQMRQQMMDKMLKHQEMMSSMKQHKPMINSMMENSEKMSSQLENNDVNLIPMKKQNRNQIGMMLQDPELQEQIQDLILQNTNTENVGNKVLAKGQSSDGSVFVEIKSSTPTPGKFLEIIETFHDKDGNILEHVNHAIHVTQEGQTVLKMSELHSHHGEVTYYTRALHSDSPIEVEVLMQGIGIEEPLTGPIDEIIVVEIA